MSRLLIWLFLPLIFAGGCTAGPAHWAEQLQESLECGMTIPEVEALAGKRLKISSGNVVWVTHYVIGRGETEMYFAFKNGKLRSSQMAWPVGFIDLATAPRMDHCAPTDTEKPAAKPEYRGQYT